MTELSGNIDQRLDGLVRNELFYVAALGILLLELLFFGSTPPLPLAWLRGILGVVFCLFIPGYVFQAALFPGRKDLDATERWTFSFLGSLVITPPIALCLSKLPWGITQVSVTIGLGTFVIACAAVAQWRRIRIREEERFQPLRAVHLPGRFVIQDATLRKAYLLLAGILAVTSITVIWILVSPKPAGRYTEFYILGKDKMGLDYPFEAVPGKPLSITFGISNFEGGPVLYRLEGRQGNSVIGTAGPVVVQNGETVESTLVFTPVTVEDQTAFQFTLYRDNQPAAYRHLELILKKASSIK